MAAVPFNIQTLFVFTKSNNINMSTLNFAHKRPPLGKEHEVDLCHVSWQFVLEAALLG
jgi:hypothetical protein